MVGGFSFNNAVGWQRGSERTYCDPDYRTPGADRPMSRMSPLGGTAALRWHAPERNFWAEASMDWSRKQAHLNEAEMSDNRFPPDGTPAWQCCNLRGGWTPNGRWSFSVGVENISDAQYRVHGSGVNEPGRNVVVTAGVNY